MATFEQWLRASFDHVPAKTDKEPEWYWQEGFDSFWEQLGITHAMAVKYLPIFPEEKAQLQPRPAELTAAAVAVEEPVPGD